MEKYILSVKSCQYADLTGGGAAYKAPHDIEEICVKCGYEKLEVNWILSNCLAHRVFAFCWQIRKIKKMIRKGSVVLIQYPSINPYLMPFMLCSFSGNRLVTVIHDINSIRETGRLSMLEKYNLDRFDDIVVHSPSMENYLRKYHIEKCQYHILGCFPYLAEMEERKRVMSKNICFAGNLNKSKFLLGLSSNLGSLSLSLYGICSDKKIIKGNVQYKGKFNTDNLFGIDGSWGLVWDGDKMDGCKGKYGDYLKIIAPHKFSLYILMGIPLIVWKNSAMADFVQRNHIGLTIDSLYDLEKEICNINVDQYDKMTCNVKEISKIISKGDNFVSILHKIYDEYLSVS